MNLELILAKKITVVESITERRLLRFEGKKGREALPAALYAMGFALCRHGEGGRARPRTIKAHQAAMTSPPSRSIDGWIEAASISNEEGWQLLARSPSRPALVTTRRTHSL